MATPNSIRAHSQLTSFSHPFLLIHLRMRFIALVAAALSSLAVVCAADANAALLVARRCPAACAINCPDDFRPHTPGTRLSTRIPATPQKGHNPPPHTPFEPSTIQYLVTDREHRSNGGDSVPEARLNHQ
ncbi:hypothetical protein B0H13DRAFT_2315880 [Mycena leptocephala]|nr:hypothetical protein B0H13DRAFT_2315880 [Mycena leptocephala]